MWVKTLSTAAASDDSEDVQLWLAGFRTMQLEDFSVWTEKLQLDRFWLNTQLLIHFKRLSGNRATSAQTRL